MVRYTFRFWLFLGCDSIIPVNISLKNSGDSEYPYKVKTDRKLSRTDSACDRSGSQKQMLKMKYMNQQIYTFQVI